MEVVSYSKANSMLLINRLLFVLGFNQAFTIRNDLSAKHVFKNIAIEAVYVKRAHKQKPSFE